MGEDMNCINCGSKMVDAFTVFTVLREGGVFVTENVPCLECPVCEHIAFTQEVARKLERYSSGRICPASTYNAWVFKWESPINERIAIDTPGTVGVW